MSEKQLGRRTSAPVRLDTLSDAHLDTLEAAFIEIGHDDGVRSIVWERMVRGHLALTGAVTTKVTPIRKGRKK